MPQIAGLFRPATLQPFYTQERCFIVEQMNTPECPDVSLAQCRVAPGVTTQLHSLTVAEHYVVQQGSGIMELGGTVPGQRQVFTVGVGDCVLIPADCAQRIRNTGADDLVFQCICTPRFEPHHYVVLEDDTTPGIAESD